MSMPFNANVSYRRVLLLSKLVCHIGHHNANVLGREDCGCCALAKFVAPLQMFAAVVMKEKSLTN
jgi:hypothetical protein